MTTHEARAMERIIRALQKNLPDGYSARWDPTEDVQLYDDAIRVQSLKSANGWAIQIHDTCDCSVRAYHYEGTPDDENLRARTIASDVSLPTALLELLGAVREDAGA